MDEKSWQREAELDRDFSREPTRTVRPAPLVPTGILRARFGADLASAHGRSDATIAASLGRQPDPAGSFNRRTDLLGNDWPAYRDAYLVTYSLTNCSEVLS